MSRARPDSKPLTPRRRKQIIAEVAAAAKEEGLSNAAVARLLRYSSSVWTAVLNGTYRGTVDNVLRRAVAWLEHRSRRALRPETVYAQTSISGRILEVCQAAAAMPTIGRVITPSGCGKTAALAEYARRRGENCLHLQIGQAFHTLRGVLAEIARRLDLRGAAGRTTPDLYALVRDHFAAFYAGGAADPFVLLADETTTLRGNALDMLRNLHDDPASRIGLVLADTDLLDQQLAAREAYRHGSEQTLGRCAAVYRFDRQREIPMADVRIVGSSILAALGHEEQLAPPAWAYLKDVAQSPGRFHNVRKILTRCREIVEAAGAEPTYSARELDFVAPLVDLPRKWQHAEAPFAAEGKRTDAEAAVA